MILSLLFVLLTATPPPDSAEVLAESVVTAYR